MSGSVFHVGNAAGFSGDRLDAPGPVADTLIAGGKPAALTFEVLAERTLALAQLAKRRDPDHGYEPMLAPLLAPVLRRCVEHGVAIVGNFGAANPRGAARRIAQLADEAGLGPVRIGIVEGDDVRETVDFRNLSVVDADAGLDLRRDAVVAANVYLGAEPIAEALGRGAQVVVTGRVADPSLTLGPLMHHFGWEPGDWDRLAAGTLAGHLIECGAQITGGYYADPGLKDVPAPDDIGFPIAEVAADGGIVVTKAAASGGLVTAGTVKEQLLYEVHDPAAYLTPDVTLDITAVTVSEIGPDRVRVEGARGRPRPDTLKATVSVEGGWLGEGEISYAGPNALARARLAGQILRDRLRRLSPDARHRIDLIGVASVLDGDDGALQRDLAGLAADDVRVRLAAASDDRAGAERAAREVLALYCDGPAGGGGVRWHVTPRIKTVSYLVPRHRVAARVEVLDGHALR
ncbi:MAG TPA: acyclic terpene utilization AtuA family protein [Geminicoccaceae bacterium]|nr:acyclic terpene utilization AtuA family protein [Geminicoccaceae bacterium]